MDDSRKPTNPVSVEPSPAHSSDKSSCQVRHLTDSVELGPVDGSIRVDNYFDGRMTEGELAGARVRGVDQIRIRSDGSVALDIRETIETDLGAISADVRGYAVPDPDAPEIHEIRGFALFSTGVEQYATYNTALVAVHGTVNMATRELEITGRPFAPELDPAVTHAAA